MQVHQYANASKSSGADHAIETAQQGFTLGGESICALYQTFSYLAPG